MVLMEHLTQLWREEKTSMYFGSLLWVMQSIMDFTKKKPNLVFLIASTVFNDSFGVKTTFIRLVNETREVKRVLTWKQWELGQEVQVMSFGTNMHLLWPHTLITQFKIYQMCLSSQSSVLNVIMNKVALLLALNLYSQLISSILEIHIQCVTIKVFSISISIILWFTLLSFTLEHIWLVSFTQFWSYIELLKLCASFNCSIS